MKLNIDNTTSRVFSINAIFTEDYKNDKVAEILKQYCAKKYGRKKEFVDAEIAARLGMLNDEPIPQVEQPVSPEQSVPVEQPISAVQPSPAQSAPVDSAPVASVTPTDTVAQHAAPSVQPVSTQLMGDHPQPAAQPADVISPVVWASSSPESSTPTQV